jgi:radical SAM protein with 4Fe4S-binding SPASM domain
MTLEEIRRVLDKIARQAQVPSISFTGGEATLRPDLPDMIRHARGLGMRVNLITNGIRAASEAYVRTLREAGLQSAQVSLEGTTAAVHEAITRVRGSFARAVRAVRRFRDAGLHVHTNTTLTRTNLADAAGFPAFVRHTLGLTAFSMNLVIPTGSAPHHDGLQVRYRELGPHLEEVLRRSRELGVEFHWYSPTPMCIFNPITHGLGNKGCAACDGLLSVGADGRVLPCASYDEPVGDLLGDSFEEVWRSAPARDFRRKFLAHDVCKACEHFHICNGACPLYWRQMGFHELLEAQGERACR